MHALQALSAQPRACQQFKPVIGVQTAVLLESSFQNSATTVSIWILPTLSIQIVSRAQKTTSAGTMESSRLMSLQIALCDQVS